MRRSVGRVARDERGVTLLELLIAMALFGIVAIGTLSALGATNAGGFLEGFPVAFAANRSAKDITAATTYLQGLHEHMAQQGGLTVGTYTFSDPSSEPFSYKAENLATGYQLDWVELRVEVQRWGWNGTAYEDGEACTNDCLFWVRSRLEWRLKDALRSVELVRFLRP